MVASIVRTPQYHELLSEILTHIRSSQVEAVSAINEKLVLLHYYVGQRIVERQNKEGWGANVIERLAVDIKKEFPDLTGFSPRSLGYMKRFATTYQSDIEFVKQVVCKVPWGHHMKLLDIARDAKEREFYLRQVIEYGWSRTMMVHHIESNLYQRQGIAPTNFGKTLPIPQSDLAQQMMKDPYNLSFVVLEKSAKEREFNKKLTEHIEKFLVELGVGFAFMGRDYRLQVGEREIFFDMLFYHVKLRAYVIVELKMVEFEAEHAGKMNLYLSAADDLLRHSADQPSIGLILCKAKDRVFVEYALRDLHKPIGVSTYEVQLLESLPKNLEKNLPSVEEFEEELAKGMQSIENK